MTEADDTDRMVPNASQIWVGWRVLGRGRGRGGGRRGPPCTIYPWHQRVLTDAKLGKLLVGGALELRECCVLRE